MASDESSMSSGSRIRQFGLYRSIDARTEEFLRLSRKRQIRQGCACAAASTAITVTVVIVIFFVYEFSLNSGTTIDNSLKSGWLNLMNDTSEDSSFDPKLTKANIDRTTLKLLPLLIKAIKKNAVLEKLLDDQSSSSPFYDKKDIKGDPDETYEPNSLTQNLLKFPSTKLYAIEFKTSPVVYYKNPTKNIEYYSKVRKIRDNQRVFNYVDKMISEKVYIRSTKPIQIEDSHTESVSNTKFKKNTYRSPKHIEPLTIGTKTQTLAHEKTKLRCKCPKNLGTVLQKILSSLQKLLPKTVHSKMTPLDCDKNMTVKANKTTPTINNLFDVFSKIPVKPIITSSDESFSTRSYPNKSLSLSTFTTETDSVTKSHNFSLNNKTFSQTTIEFNEPFTMSENDFEDHAHLKSLTPHRNITEKILLNKVKNMIKKQKQLLKHPELKTHEPIFDGIEYDDYGTTINNYFTSTLRNTPLNNNKIHYMATKVNYLNDILYKNYKKRTMMPIKYNKGNKFLTIPKQSTNLDMKVVDNKVTLIKTKSTRMSKTNISTKKLYDNVTLFPVYDTVTDAVTHLSKLTTIPSDEEITFDLVNANLNYPNEEETESLTKNDITYKPTHVDKKINSVTRKPTYFKYATNSQEDRTIYHLVKNSLQTFLNKTAKQVPVLNVANINPTNNEYKANDKVKNANKTAIYLLIENHVNTFLRKNFSTLKQKLRKTKTLLKTLYKNKNNQKTSTLSITTTSKPYDKTLLIMSKNDSDTWFKKIITTSKPRSNISMLNTFILDKIKNEMKLAKIHIDKEILKPSDSGEEKELLITEITKPPGSSIYKHQNDSLLEKKSQELTWEDLTNEFMPAWRSMIPDPTATVYKQPLYIEYHKPDEQQEEDFSINSNFYDLNM